MKLLLIRHGHAGQPRVEHDRYRPLTDEGRDHANGLAQSLQSTLVTRVLSSPATRCMQTVEPLAALLGVEVLETENLWEGTPINDVLKLLNLIAAEGTDTVACSHGDIIPEVIEHLGHQGVEVQGRGCERGSVWILTFEQGDWVNARYVNRKDALADASNF